MAAVPLRRNRDFVWLHGGQLLSSAGSESTAIAYPLLVLAPWGTLSPAVRNAPSLVEGGEPTTGRGHG
jgi:hypothetical protein